MCSVVRIAVWKCKVENNRIVKARPDKNNPRSEGYVCRKGLNIGFHQHNALLSHRCFSGVEWSDLQAWRELFPRQVHDGPAPHGPSFFHLYFGSHQEYDRGGRFRPAALFSAETFAYSSGESEKTGFRSSRSSLSASVGQGYGAHTGIDF